MSYTFDFNQTRGTNPGYTNPTSSKFYEGRSVANGGSYVRKPTDAQIKYYMDLCVQRKVTPKNYMLMTYEQLSDEINAVRQFFPASETQIQMILDKVANLQGMGVEIATPNADALSKLTGGREGTASAFIESLIQLERENADNAPPTDKQLEFMVSMFLCPDVEFEERFGITRRIPMPEVAENAWRRPTPEEFAEILKGVVKRRDASKFIDDMRGVFHTWKQTRIRPEQQRYIRQLEDRMANLGSPKQVEFSVDQYGNITQVQKQTVDKSSSYSPKGYQSLDDMQLSMFSVEEASTYIDQLKAELGRKEMYSYRDESDNSMTFEEIRGVKDENDAKVKEFTALQDLIFKLEAVAGYENQEVHDAVNYYLIEEAGNKEALEESKKVIKDFMMFLLEGDYISFENLMDMCREAKVAQNILIGR